jgi:hypothetical protein
MYIPIYLAPKTAFLISPLDMGGIAAFKAYYHRLDRSTIDLKIRADQQAWDQVSNESLRNICINCGVIGEESFASIRERFMKQVVNIVPSEISEHVEYYESWVSGKIEVEGCTRARGVHPNSVSPFLMVSTGTTLVKKSRGERK